MSKCAVVGCKTIDKASNTAVTFHRVTKNKKFLPLWERVVKLRANSKPSKICSLHFKDGDFFENRGKKCLKVHAVPSLNMFDREYSTDDEENESLSKLSRLIKTSEENSMIAKEDKNTANSDSDYNVCDPNLTEQFQMVSCCYGRTSDIGIQTVISTKKEIALQAKVNKIELTISRRDAKINHLQSVLDMVKKHVKGTDMEYKLCCELENISKATYNFGDRKSNFSIENKRLWIEDEQSGDEEEDACMSVEVVHSSNLNAK